MSASEHATALTLGAAKAAASKLAQEIIALDVSEQLIIVDAFFVASADNDRQVMAIVDAVEEALRELGAKPLRREGVKEARWVLLDYGELVVHIQHTEDREYYALERLWKDCPAIDVSAAIAAGNDAANQVS